MKQKTIESKRFWISIGIGIVVAIVLLAANLWQLKTENSVMGVKQVWSDFFEK